MVIQILKRPAFCYFHVHSWVHVYFRAKIPRWKYVSFTWLTNVNTELSNSPPYKNYMTDFVNFAICDPVECQPIKHKFCRISNKVFYGKDARVI